MSNPILLGMVEKSIVINNPSRRDETAPGENMGKSTRKAVLGLALAVLAVLAGYNLYLLKTPPRPNILMIGVDALRADHLGCYGYARDTSPAIDRLARQGALFENCLVPTPRTTPTIASIMTGRYPRHHGVRRLRDPLPSDQITLAQVLQSFGYWTLGVQANSVLDGLVDEGFDHLMTAPFEPGVVGWMPADRTTAIALKLLERVQTRPAPFFMWVFYFDPHMPYKPAALRFDKDYQGRFGDELNFLPNKLKLTYANAMTEREREHAVALYDSEIRNLDDQIRILVEAVEEKYPDTIVVLTADHGENLGEHNYYYDHGDLLDQAALRVPLIIRGMEFGKTRVKKLVRSIDILPTLLAHLNIVVPDARFDGTDLAAYALDPDGRLDAFGETGQADEDIVYSAGFRFVRGIEGRLQCLTLGNRRALYIPTPEGPRHAIYDVEKDPAQRVDLGSTPEAQKMFRQLDDWVSNPNQKVQKQTLSPEDRERLRTLGYM